MKNILDEALIKGIRENSEKSEDILFDRFIGIEKYYDIPEEAKMSIYVDTISDTILNLRKRPFKKIDNLKAYIKRILSNKVNKFLKLKISDRERYAQMDRDIFERTMEDIPESQFDEERQQSILDLAKEIFAVLSARCKEVLHARFIQGLSFSELAEELDYSSEGSARLANHDCLKQARNKSANFKDRYYGE